MQEECNHYWVEIFHHGKYNDRWFKCIFCNTSPMLKTDNTPINFRDIEVTRAWEVVFKARSALV